MSIESRKLSLSLRGSCKERSTGKLIKRSSWNGGRGKMMIAEVLFSVHFRVGDGSWEPVNGGEITGTSNFEC